MYHKMDTIEQINLIKHKYDTYVSNIKYVWKSCKRDWIIIMEKMNDTIKNETRLVYNSDYAKYRANKLKVICIFNKFDPNITLSEIENKYKNFIVNYIVGEVVYADSYDENINNICSSGIHYFKTIEPAFYFDLRMEMIDGTWIGWFSDGQKWLEGIYINGKQCGIWVSYGHKEKYIYNINYR